MRKPFLLAAAMALLMPVSAARAAEPEVVSIVDQCPVSEGGYQYSADVFEYRILVWLKDCPWYHGETVVVRGSVVRTDPVTGPVQHRMTVYCEPGAPPADDRRHSHEPAAVPGLPAPTAQHDAPDNQNSRRPPEDCALSLVVPHPTVEHARYEGELHYPSGQGEQHESLALDCTNVHQFGGCDPPGSPPGITPPPGLVPPPA